jgi:hypothetical protein
MVRYRLSQMVVFQQSLNIQVLEYLMQKVVSKVSDLLVDLCFSNLGL